VGEHDQQWAQKCNLTSALIIGARFCNTLTPPVPEKTKPKTAFFCLKNMQNTCFFDSVFGLVSKR
jgi:hypothetical protein